MNPAVPVEIVRAPGCPRAKEARTRLLRAFSAAGVRATWKEWLSNDPDLPDHLAGLPSPTTLVEGAPVAPTAGAAEPTPAAAPCCAGASQAPAAPTRECAGLPSVEDLSAALRGEATAPPARPQRTAMQATLAAVPGVAAALLPKVTCPACWPAYAGVLSALGMGFLLETRVLLPLTSGFLGLTLFLLAFRASRRRGLGPFALGLAASVVVLVGKFHFESDPAMYGGIALLVAASAWNSWPRRRPRAGGACSACPPPATA